MRAKRSVVGLLGLLVVPLSGPGGASAATVKYITSPLWDTNHVYVSCDADCHVAGGRGVGQDVIGWASSTSGHHNGDYDHSVLVVTPMQSGHYGIIVGVWTADGWHQHQSGAWHFHGTGNGCGSVPQPWGNGYDLYVGDNANNLQEVYRFAHMKTDGTWFWQSGAYIYARYAPGNKLSWGQTMGYYDNTGWSCGDHLHWHIAVGSDSSRYAPTYSSLDNVGVEYGVWGSSYNGNGPTIDELNLNCWVSSTNNCNPRGFWR